MNASQAAGAVIAALALAIYGWPDAVGLDSSLGPPAAAVFLALGLWATGALPFHLTSLGLFALVTVLDVAPAAVIFAGFASTALWLVFGGLVIGTAVQKTGLGGRLARLVVARLDGSYRRVIYGTVALGVGLAFLVPAAMGRIVIMVPIFAAVADELGFARGRTGRTGLFLAVTFGTVLPAFAILPANLPNMVLLGVADTLYGLRISYAAYLALHFPVLGLLHALLLAELICRLFPDRPGARTEHPTARTDHPTAGAEQPPWSAEEVRLLAILLAALALWATDSFHGISPGWVALAAGVACLAPAIGIVDVRTFETATNFGVLFYVAGILGVVSLIDGSGLATAIGAAALDWVPLQPGASAANFATLVGTAAAVGLVATHAGLPAVLGPLAPAMAEGTGLPLASVLMTQIVGLAATLLPYQSAPLMVALQLADVRLGAATRLSLLLGALVLLVLAPLDFLWWRWLGYLG